MRMVNGQQAFGRAALDTLLERGQEVVGVFTAPEQEGGRPDPLKEGAVDHGIPLFQPKSFRREAVWEQIRELEPDLGVMAYVTLFGTMCAATTPVPRSASGNRWRRSAGGKRCATATPNSATAWCASTGRNSATGRTPDRRLDGGTCAVLRTADHGGFGGSGFLKTRRPDNPQTTKGRT